MGHEPVFEEADEEHQVRERNRARELRRSQWWKNQRGKGVCYYCRRRVAPKALTMDHIVPIVRSGKTTKTNVVPCCGKCNRQKKNLLPVEWQQYLERLAEE